MERSDTAHGVRGSISFLSVASGKSSCSRAHCSHNEWRGRSIAMSWMIVTQMTSKSWDIGMQLRDLKKKKRHH